MGLYEKMGRPKIVRQGNVVIEYYGRGEYMLMYPNGQVGEAPTHEKALKKAQAWMKKHKKIGSNEIGLWSISWRNRT